MPSVERPEAEPCVASCCGADLKFDGATPAYRRVLLAVIGINVAAFAVVAAGSLIQGSASLGANALDFAGDSATYAISLWAIGRAAPVRARAAMIKGASLVGLALAILGFAVWRAVAGAAPEGSVISGLGLFGVAANVVAAVLLVPYRDGDANVRSVWLCTRNDLIECLAVAVTGGVVWLTGWRWPDLVVGVILAGIFLRSAWQIITQARAELTGPPPAPDAAPLEIVMVRRQRPA